MPFLKGALPSPIQRAFAAVPFRPIAGIPTSFGVVPPKLSIWGNDRYGDCVTAEEAAAKAAYSVAAGLPEIFIDEATVIAWARKHGVLNGATLTEVMDAMATDGIQATDGKVYHDGPYHSVDWTNDATLSSAIYTGPVKIGVASGPLESAGAGTKNGWFLTGQKRGGSLDHCVGLCGYGTVAECAAFLNVAVPKGTDLSARAYLLFTWGTIGVIDRASLIAITGEAWLRTPTTPDQPTPDPQPGPPPPGPAPVPVPGGAISLDLDTKTITAPAGWSLAN